MAARCQRLPLLQGCRPLPWQTVLLEAVNQHARQLNALRQERRLHRTEPALRAQTPTAMQARRMQQKATSQATSQSGTSSRVARQRSGQW